DAVDVLGARDVLRPVRGVPWRLRERTGAARVAVLRQPRLLERLDELRRSGADAVRGGAGFKGQVPGERGPAPLEEVAERTEIGPEDRRVPARPLSHPDPSLLPADVSAYAVSDPDPTLALDQVRGALRSRRRFDAAELRNRGAETRARRGRRFRARGRRHRGRSLPRCGRSGRATRRARTARAAGGRRPGR